MPNTTIGKTFTFEAAHQLPDYKGKCARLHGHSYKLSVSVSGEKQEDGPHKGMIIDLVVLSEIVHAEIIDKWDHQPLHEILSFTTTVEMLAEEIFRLLDGKLPSGVVLEEVVLFETATCWAKTTRL
ncbi:MAG: 6-carboxytetrahydropterin synthase QueD [Candidatus Pacebacteria bacterium]|nr:6-carboxytetrahydropterin synthase QueD [Candidatus Paceibacterota bacterium]